MERTLTIEIVDKQLQSLELLHSKKVTAKATPLEALCAVVQMAIPILKFAKAAFFFRKPWQLKLQDIINKAGAACK